MIHAKGGDLGQTWSLNSLKRSLPMLEDYEPGIANKRGRKEVTKQGNIGRTSLCSSDMQPQIWRNFPEDLLEVVLARLPIFALVRFRLVCKKWNLLLTKKSRTFSIPQSQPWFYSLNRTCDGEYLVSMYDPCSKKWYHPDFPCLPTSNKYAKLVGSAGGLICFVNESYGQFYVWNPITQAIKELPRLDPQLAKDGSFGAMTLSSTTTGNDNDYIIIWIDPYGFYSFYHSRDNSWTPTKRIPSDDIVEWMLLDSYSHVVHMNGTLYLTIDEPRVIASCDMTTGIWKMLNVPFPINLVRHWITDYQGKILLVGLVKDDTTYAQQICLWELQKMTLLWKEIDKMPEIMSIDLCNMTCFGNKGDSIMWTLNSGPEQRHVIYKFKTREWLSTVPSSVHQPQRESQGTAFQPCLFVLP